MKAVHFGAGNIGRGFIGLLLSQSGYDVFFVTRNKKKIALLQQRRHYRVTLAEANASPITVHNVTAASIDDSSDIADAVTEADLVTTAVGVYALKDIAKSIARGIAQRLRREPRSLNIIACENMVGGSSQLKKWVYSHLTEAARREADRYIAFPNAVVDRIVPLQQHTDILAVTVEPFAEWVIDRSQVIERAPQIQGAIFVDSLAPYIERKLYTLNTGHCAAAYYGYLEGYDSIHQVMENSKMREKVEAVLQETGAMLIQKHHLDERSHQVYVRKILQRFSNPNLMDAVVRVGRCPIRKVSANDRLVRPLLLAYDLGLDTPHLVSLIAAALLFDYEDDAQAVRLQATIQQQGIDRVLSDMVGIPSDHPLHGVIQSEYLRMKSTYGR